MNVTGTLRSLWNPASRTSIKQEVFEFMIRSWQREGCRHAMWIKHLCVKSTFHRLLEQYSWKDVINADRESMVSFEKYLSHFSLHTYKNVFHCKSDAFTCVLLY